MSARHNLGLLQLYLTPEVVFSNGKNLEMGDGGRLESSIFLDRGLYL
jgi:hypothetical protein